MCRGMRRNQRLGLALLVVAACSTDPDRDSKPSGTPDGSQAGHSLTGEAKGTVSAVISPRDSNLVHPELMAQGDQAAALIPADDQANGSLAFTFAAYSDGDFSRLLDLQLNGPLVSGDYPVVGADAFASTPSATFLGLTDKDTGGPLLLWGSAGGTVRVAIDDTTVSMELIDVAFVPFERVDGQPNPATGSPLLSGTASFAGFTEGSAD